MLDAWREAFDHAPEQALADLFSGRAGLGSDLRLDTPELLALAFPDLPGEAPARERLDGALLAWISGMRRDYPRQVARLGFGVYAKRLCDGLIAAQLLVPPRTIHHLRDQMDSWARWLGPLRIAPERDPSLELWRLLSLRQNDASALPIWFQLARDGRPEYLDTALLGLRRLDNGGDARRNQVLLLSALLHHGVASYATAAEALAFFKKRYAGLRGLYLRGPSHWRQDLGEAVEEFARNHRGPMVKEFLDRLREPDRGRKRARKGEGGRRIEPSDQYSAVRDAIEARREPSEQLAECFFALQGQNLRYAEVSGDSYNFTSSLSNLGTPLLKYHRLSQRTLKRLERMVEQGLAWEPYSPFIWMLWAQLLGKQGRQEPCEWVLREAVRLFPDNEPARVELARLLIRRGPEHYCEAESWLREAAERSPNHEPSRVELARLLIQRGPEHYDEAEAWLREAAERSPNHEPSRFVLAALLARWRRLPEAIHLLQEFAKRRKRVDARFLKLLTKLQARLAPDADSAESDDDLIAFLDTEPSSEDPEEEEPADEDTSSSFESPMATLMAGLEHRARLQAAFMRARTAGAPADDDLAESAAAGDAMAGLFLQWLRPESTTPAPPHAWAWRACRLYRQGTAEGWEELNRDCAGQRAYADLIRYLAGDAPADDELERRLARWAERHEAEPGAASPVTRFAVNRYRRFTATPPSAAQRDDTVLAILGAQAADAPLLSL